MTFVKFEELKLIKRKSWAKKKASDQVLHFNNEMTKPTLMSSRPQEGSIKFDSTNSEVNVSLDPMKLIWLEIWPKKFYYKRSNKIYKRIM